MKKVVRLGDGIREAVFGANDGVVSTFGILAGMVGASIGSSTIALVGVIQMFAAGLSMGLGAYISTKSQNEFYEAAESREREEILHHPAKERRSVRSILHKKGLQGDTLDDATKSLTKKKSTWLHFILEERLGIAETSYPHPIFAGCVMFIAFVMAGAFSVVPFFFFTPLSALYLSGLLSLLILFLVGSIKTKFTRKHWLKSGLENLLVGLATGIVGFAVGAFIQGMM